MVSSAWIVHVDLDQFQAAVEVRRRPELRGRPVVVGGTGDPTQPRTVVTCASYEARALGARAGMPLAVAARKCPEATFLPVDDAAYQAASDEVMGALRGTGLAVEVWGLDEAFLAADAEDPEVLAADIQATVRTRTGLSCSVGAGPNKQCAKLAAGFAKPAGIYRLDQRNWTSVMAERPVRALWGVGAKTAKKLTDLGLGTVAELAAADPGRLAERFGATTGRRFHDLAHGRGDADVTTAPRVPRSRSRTRTFRTDLTDRDELDRRLASLARELMQDVGDTGRPAVRVAVTVRNSSFFTRTRTTTLPTPTSDGAVVAAAALDVLTRFELDRPVRLLGVRVDLDGADGGTS